MTNPTTPLDECPFCGRKPPRHHALCPRVVNPPEGYERPRRITAPKADPCLAAFEELMSEKRLSIEKVEGNVPPFKNCRVEAMWEGFVCAWSSRQQPSPNAAQANAVVDEENLSLIAKEIWSDPQWNEMFRAYKCGVNDCTLVPSDFAGYAVAIIERHLRPATHDRALLERVRDALDAAPVYVTKDGTWLNFRPDADKRKGGALIKVEGLEAEAIRAFGEKVEQALATLNDMLKEKP